MNIGIQNTDPVTLGSHSQGKVDGDGRLSHPTLAGCHGDYVLDPFDHN